ncbi:NAD(P)-dependent oxidoreductase [Streptomyces calidiresistens]|uniref:DUF1932 domain-containing protein n=1 Tax=Streptomyces calidiresistens TaxID=1485586 RepID=A0A7W3T095_9ACTN|nr:DUF1932 domain-containing protein [Streptomyces calidiresistens]MBB0228542.1 DUF1932 domain-containing protein [Streptomyces calidiresistens]
MVTITLLHPGTMGTAIGAEARKTGTRVLWVPRGRSEATRRRAEQAGFEATPSLTDALDVSDLVLSVCPTQVADEVADRVAETGYEGLFIEANALGPAHVARIAARLTPASVVDACIFGPDSHRHRVAHLYLSADAPAQRAAELLATAFAGTRVETTVVSGSAAALKMAFVAHQRSSRVLAAVSHALARSHGVGDELLREARLMGADTLADPGYFPTLAARAWRWHPELDEVAGTLRDAGLPSALAHATTEVMARWEDDKDASPSVEAVLDRLFTETNGP